MRPLRMNAGGAGLSQKRLATARAMVLLLLARLVVRFVPLKLFRASLGEMRDGSQMGADLGPSCKLELAQAMASRIERATLRLPGESKCLPRAIALQWSLRLTGIESQLVLAIHRSDRSSRHAYHAWVENDGGMLIGHCERSEYRPVMIFAQNGRERADRAASAW
ncbi:lasso peptide biosynthesis B2 protein [Altererythrobacter sp.]|uniref:lasso peptide biosynthesis B2 protein n=1 Tax=Altererythrobacter sp. TaxID=1872480 RepID=UPI003D009BAD